MLRDMLDENKAAIVLAEETLSRRVAEKQTEETRLAVLTEQYSCIADWAQEFDHCNTDEKKMILARIIEKITVDKDYHITIHFFLTVEDLQNTVSDDWLKVTATETNMNQQTIAG